MKALLALAFLFSTSVASADQIADLKRDFPAKHAERVGKPGTAPEKMIEISVPHSDVWAWYRGAFQTATKESLPATLKSVEARMASDVARMAGKGSGYSERAQFSKTCEWINGPLRAYVARWKSLPQKK